MKRWSFTSWISFQKRLEHLNMLKSVFENWFMLPKKKKTVSKPKPWRKKERNTGALDEVYNWINTLYCVLVNTRANKTQTWSSTLSRDDHLTPDSASLEPLIETSIPATGARIQHEECHSSIWGFYENLVTFRDSKLPYFFINLKDAPRKVQFLSAIMSHEWASRCRWGKTPTEPTIAVQKTFLNPNVLAYSKSPWTKTNMYTKARVDH